MKLITLNIWGGHVRNPLMEFVSSHSDIDIFCLQEVYHNAKDKKMGTSTILTIVNDRMVEFRSSFF